MAYDPAVPTGIIPLNQDYVNLQENFSQLNTQFNKDHVPLTSTSGNPPNGYHTSIHFVQGSFVGNTSGSAQLYSQTVAGGDQALFINTGTGNLTAQLTLPMVPKAAGNGYTFLPGGIIIQWGQTASILGNGGEATINFNTSNINFPNAVFNAQATPRAASGTYNGYSILSVSTETLVIRNTMTVDAVFYWTVIGN